MTNFIYPLDEEGNQFGNYEYFDFLSYKPFTYNYEEGVITTEGCETEYKYNQYLNLEVAYAADLAAVKHNLDLKLLSLDVEGKKAAIETAETGYKALYEAAKKNADAKKAAYEAAADADKATAKSEWEWAVVALEIAQGNLETAENDLAQVESIVEQMNATYAIISDTSHAMH